MQKMRGFQVYLGCNSFHLAGFENSQPLQCHKRNPTPTEEPSPKRRTWLHTSSVLELPVRLLSPEGIPELGLWGVSTLERHLTELDMSLQGSLWAVLREL